MFKEPAYWMYYFWSKNKRARKDKAVISNATWTMAILWLLNLTGSPSFVRGMGMGYADGLVLFPDGQGGMEQVQTRLPICSPQRRSLLLSGLPESCITVLRS